jgi:ergothioneine biosynthesis protein EgtB
VRLAAARRESDRVFATLEPGALYDRAIPERHRPIFYLGHLEAFDWNLLRETLAVGAPFEAELDRLFAFGIDPVAGQLPGDKPSDWPGEERVRRYGAEVRARLDQALDAAARPHGDPEDALFDRLHVAVEHRLMHVETLAYLLHALPHDRKRGAADAARRGGPWPGPQEVAVPAGRATLGQRRESGEFGWDNEYAAQSVEVASFRMDRYKVTNGQFLEFVRAGGYGERSFWSHADWEWVRRSGTSHPWFWSEGPRGQWLYRGMFGAVPLPGSWPVWVSHAEAAAYARWAGKALPTEAEWQRAAYGTPDGPERRYPWGDAEPGDPHGNFGLRRFDPAPVGSFPKGESAFGIRGLVGNGWEWTSSPFRPLPGFEPMPFYPGYSAPFFDDRHFVLKGASPRTDAAFLRRSFRNWFQPHYPYVYAGFRCVAR